MKVELNLFDVDNVCVWKCTLKIKCAVRARVTYLVLHLSAAFSITVKTLAR